MTTDEILPHDLQTLYTSLNAAHFDNLLPPCEIVWSRKLTRAAGNINVRAKKIQLSTPLLIDAFASGHGATLTLFGPEYMVCGVPCGDAFSALREILKHEMIHLWLHVQGVPCGHTREFRVKAKLIGQPKTRHGIALPAPKSGWSYHCPACATVLSRRKRFGRAVACAKCCKRFNGGAYDERFKLRGRKIA